MIQAFKFEPKSTSKFQGRHQNWRETTTSQTQSTQNKKNQPFSQIYDIKTQVSRFEYNNNEQQKLKHSEQVRIQIEQQRSIQAEIPTASKEAWNLRNKLDFIPDLTLQTISELEKEDISLKFVKITINNQLSNFGNSKRVNNQQNLCFPPTPYGFDTNRSRVIVGNKNVVQYLSCSVDQFKRKIKQIRSLYSPEKQKNIKNKGIKLTQKK